MSPYNYKFKFRRRLRKRYAIRFGQIWRNFIDQFNVTKYDRKSIVLLIFRILRIFALLLSFCILIYYYGFNIQPNEKAFLMLLIRPIFATYIASYIVNLIFSFEQKNYLRNTWFEGAFLAFLVVQGIYFFYNKTVTPANFYIQLLLFILIIIEIGKAATKLPLLHIGASSLLIYSFIGLILTGTGLLMLPEMTVNKVSMPFIDALFTATSASCVTGLIVVDTASYFSLKGQLMILLLIQAGGLSIISFATFFALFVKQSHGLKQQSIMVSFLSTENLQTTKSLLKRIVLFSLGFELIGAIMLFFLWPPAVPFDSILERIYYSLFHSISAFNNAGFSLFSNNLFEPIIRNSYFVHMIIAFLIICGGLGFAVLDDLFSLKNIRDRLRNPWKPLRIHTKIVLYTSSLLILMGAIVFYILERNNTMAEMDTFGAVVTSFFQSITPRTAGFNTVDTALIAQPTMFFIMFLMFVGASSGSTGGGIKTSTFAVIVSTVFSTIRGKQNVEMFHCNISAELFKRAISVFSFALVVIFIGTFILLISDPQFRFGQLLFEEISAFGTVGLSRGITFQLSEIGKIVIIVTMFIGRVGTLTLAFAITGHPEGKRELYRYPQANFMVG